MSLGAAVNLRFQICRHRRDIPPCDGGILFDAVGEKGFGPVRAVGLIGDTDFSCDMQKMAVACFHGKSYKALGIRTISLGEHCGEVGEIVLVPKDGKKPLGVFVTYLDNEELYRNAWRGGVYHTGDAAWQDENGAIWFHGRFDDIIKSGGYRIGPYEIENILVEHPAVFECSVVGIPDPLRGQAIKAFVVPAKGYEPSKELDKEIKEYCNSRMAEYKWIRTIEFVSEMPKTISGKIRKSELRKQG